MSLSKEIETIVKSVANNNPAPMRCEIIKVYNDGNVDVKTENGVLKYVDAIGDNVLLGSNAVILFFDEDYNDYVVIADTEQSFPCDFQVINENLVFDFCDNGTGGGSGGEGVDINTVKELINSALNNTSIDVEFDLMDNGYVKIGAELNRGS